MGMGWEGLVNRESVEGMGGTRKSWETDPAGQRIGGTAMRSRFFVPVVSIFLVLLPCVLPFAPVFCCVWFLFVLSHGSSFTPPF